MVNFTWMSDSTYTNWCDDMQTVLAFISKMKKTFLTSFDLIIQKHTCRGTHGVFL